MYVDQVVRSLPLAWFDLHVMFSCSVVTDHSVTCSVFLSGCWWLHGTANRMWRHRAACGLPAWLKNVRQIINMLQVTVQRNKDRLITSWLLSCFLFAFENKNVPRERWEFVTDSDTGPHQVIFRCFRASGPHHLCWCVMEKGALKETYTFHWERNIKGGGHNLRHHQQVYTWCQRLTTLCVWDRNS